MKKGINQWSFPETMSVRECMDLAKKAGFEGIELNLSEEGEFSLKTPEKDLIDIMNLAKNIGIELSSLSLESPYFLTDEDESNVRMAKEHIKKALKIAAKLGMDTILVVPGGVDVSIWSPNSKIVSYDLAYEKAQSALKDLSSVAKENGVFIGIENVWNKFLLSPLEFKNFIDEINAEYIKVYFDVGNVLINGYPEQWIRILDKRIKKIHIKDFKVNIGNINGFVNLLEGDVNWPEVVKALNEIGYDGYITAEMIPPYKFYPERLIYDTSKAMDRILFGER